MLIRHNIIKLSLFFIFLSSLFAACDSIAQPAKSIQQSGLDSILAETSNYTPGAILLVSSPKQRYFKAAGLAEKNTNIAMPKDASLRVGSVTKTFVSALTMMTVNDGQVDLDAPIDVYIDQAVLDKLPKGLNPTVRQLLNHSSGIPDYYSVRFYKKDWKDRGPLTTDLVLNAIDGKKATMEPGEKFKYSNTNYHLLALILEKVYGQSLDSLFQTHLFDPLNLTGTRYGMSQIEGDKVHGYARLAGKEYNTFTWEENTGPDGGIFSTAPDLEAWLKALFTKAGKFRNIGDQMRVNPLQESERKFQGMGVEIMHSKSGSEVYGHTGGVDGYFTAAFYIPEKDAVMVLYINRSDEKGFSKTLGQTLKHILTSDEF